MSVITWVAKNASAIIALCALVVSIYSLYVNNLSFIQNSRPYVYAMSYAIQDANTKLLIPQPQKLLYKVLNRPAKILRVEISLVLREGTIESVLYYNDDKNNAVRFPAQDSQWWFSFGTNDYKMYMNNLAKGDIYRNVAIEYQALGGGTKYHYELQQKYDTLENDWKSKSETSD